MSICIGFSKGRGASKCIQLLEPSGIKAPPEFHSGRMPVFTASENNLTCVLVRGQDLPWMLEAGHLDVAIGTPVWFKEHRNPAFIRVAKLAIQPCRLSLIALDGYEKSAIHRISTRFPNITAHKMRGQNPNVQIIPMAGCNEVSLALGFADAIVDIVETGWTVEQMALKELEVFYHLSHSIWMRRENLVQLDTLHRLIPGVNFRT